MNESNVIINVIKEYQEQTGKKLTIKEVQDMIKFSQIMLRKIQEEVEQKSNEQT